MKQPIVDRFALNISRVKNLVAIYQSTLAGTGQGRRSHQKTDVLRAAVVLLHASVEDVLRSLAYWKLPNAATGVLDQFPLVGNGPAMKFSLGALAAHRGKTVDDVLRSLAYWKLPNAATGVLDQFPLVGNGPAMKFSLGALAAHRGKTVDD